MSIEQYEEVYLEMLDRSVNKHKDEILVLKGVEIEYLPELETLYPKFLKDLDFYKPCNIKTKKLRENLKPLNECEYKNNQKRNHSNMKTL